MKEKTVRQTDHQEKGIEIPCGRIAPETLRAMVREFVSRDWMEMSDAGITEEEKINRVLRQLGEGKAKVVYDQVSESWNIVPTP